MKLMTKKQLCIFRQVRHCGRRHWVNRLDYRLCLDNKRLFFTLKFTNGDSSVNRDFSREVDAFKFALRHAESTFTIDQKFQLKNNDVFVRHTDFFECCANLEGELYDYFYDDSPITESEEIRRCSL